MELSREIADAFSARGVPIDLLHSSTGPSVIRFELSVPAKIGYRKLAGVSKELAMTMGIGELRLSRFEGARGALALEVPNPEPYVLEFEDMICRFQSREPVALALPLGLKLNAELFCDTLSRMPHLLVAGMTGSGKSIFLHTLICSAAMAYSPRHIRMILVDMKMVEFSLYEDLPHLVGG